MLLEQLLKAPGFLYELNGTYYYLGKWICKKCTQTDASDSLFMYQMCRSRHEENEADLYFQKIRAYSDFALEAPCNPAGVHNDMTHLFDTLSEAALESLETQFHHFHEDYSKYTR